MSPAETGLYYLQSRYYNPEWGRFINADAFASTGQGFVGNNMFAYCRNNPVCRKDISGTADVDIFDDGDSNLLDDDKTFSGSKMSNGSSGESSSNFKGRMGKSGGYKLPNPQSTNVSLERTQPTVFHGSGTGSPKNNINPGGSYTKLDSNGKVYSYTQYDNLGRQTMRIDFQGRPHAGVLPHIHLYIYPQKGGRAEYIFDFDWKLID